MKKTFIDEDTKLNYEIEIKNFNYAKNEYIVKHLKELLPDWLTYPQTIIFLFFQCKYPLNGSNLPQEQLEKDRLLLKFNQLGKEIYYQSKKQGILSEIICPKSGFSQYSTQGTQIFSIPHLLDRNLSSFQVKSGQCEIIHPLWGQAVYPCIIFSMGNIRETNLILSSCLSLRNDKLLCNKG